MSYPPYGGGYPQQPGFGGAPGYPQQGGAYPPPGGAGGMPTPESASAAAYGQGGGMGYAPQPSGPGGIGFNAGPPMPGGPPGPGYPPAPNVSMPAGPQPGYPAQPGYPTPGAYPQAPAGGANPQPPGGYGGPQPPYGAPQGAAPPYGQPQQGGVPPYGGAGAPVPGYGAPPAATHAPPQGYGAPPQGGAGYGAPPVSQGGYGGAPPGGYGAAPAQQGGYGGYGTGQPGQPGHQQPPAASQNFGSAVPSPSTYKIREEGTLKPFPNFNVEQDVQILRKAMKGFGTDEKAIIDIIGRRSCDQRQNIKMMYKTCFGRDLVQDLKSELGGRFEDAMVALMMKSDDFDARELRGAMKGIGTDEAALIEILCTKTNAEIHAIVAAYKLLYNRKLEEDIISETSGHFKKLLVSMSAGGRQESQQVDVNKARTDAQRLYQSGEQRWGTDENMFNMVMASQSYEQLRVVFDEYIKVSGKDIEKAIKNEMSGDVSSGMLTLVRVIRNKHAYFADRLYHSMKGLGTDDRTLIRIVVSRCERDMKQIKAEFQNRYGKNLESFVRDDVSGDYRRLMLALVTG